MCGSGPAGATNPSARLRLRAIAEPRQLSSALDLPPLARAPILPAMIVVSEAEAAAIRTVF